MRETKPDLFFGLCSCDQILHIPVLIETIGHIPETQNPSYERMKTKFSNPTRGVRRIPRAVRSTGLFLCLVVAVQTMQCAEPPADLVVLNGKVVTVDPRSSIVEAAAIRDGRFVAVGANAEVKKLVGDQTRVIDARGKTVVPGLIETHVHAIGVAQGE